MAEYIECYTCNPTSCDGCNIHILAKMLHAGKLDRLMDDHHTIIETADVAPVVHGRWMEMVESIEDGYTGEYYDEIYYNCLNCDYASDDETPYCPNCGARMDGE
jgi:rubrerythrin